MVLLHIVIIGLSECHTHRVLMDCGHWYHGLPPLPSSLCLKNVDCGFIKPHFWLKGPLPFTLTHRVIVSLTVGNTWQTLAWSLTIERQVKSRFQMRSETRVWRKKECAEDKRWYGRKERKHLNSSVVCPPHSKLPCLVYAALFLPLTSSHPSPILHLQTKGLPEKVWSHSLSSQLPASLLHKCWHLASETIATITRMQD